ncbi:hypothetical protein [Echinicola pacifica]|nr:hypothetical protein [Echinicola pacifica]
MLNKIGLFSLLLMCLLSCNKQEEKVENLKNEILSIHDEVMPLMGEIKEDQRKLLEKSSALFLQDSVGNEKKILELNEIADRLDKAYESMFVWMRQYKVDFEGMKDEEVIAYLEEQKIKVSKVNEDITQALSDAKKQQTGSGD